MTVYRIDATLPYITHLPRDVAINTFHIATSGDIDGSQVSTAFELTRDFYNNVLGDFSIASRISQYVDRSTDLCKLEIREVGVPGPGTEASWTLGAGAGPGESLPFEVSVCLSYQGNASGVLARRQRGRIYIGPLAPLNSVITFLDDQPPLVAGTFTFDLALAATAYGNALAAADITWGVYSRVDEELYPIVAGFVDNEFDTQRRRQVKATSRQTWDLPGGPT